MSFEVQQLLGLKIKIEALFEVIKNDEDSFE